MHTHKHKYVKQMTEAYHKEKYSLPLSFCMSQKHSKALLQYNFDLMNETYVIYS